VNSYERTMAVLKGNGADRLPAMPIFMTWLAPRVGRSYRDYVTDYRVLVEGQQWLVDAFEIDVVSVISDAWREAADCGAELTFWDNEPPACRVPLLQDEAALTTLRCPDPLAGGRMTDRVQAVASLAGKFAGEVPVMGWIEGPLAEACCLRGVNQTMLDLIDDPLFATDLLDFATEMEIDFAIAQIDAGADIIGMGDAAASLCGPRFYDSMVLPREQQIVRAVHQAGALLRLHICGNTNDILAPMAETGADIIDLDYPVDRNRARAEMGDGPVLAGNFEPVGVLLNRTPEEVFDACRDCHRAFGPRHIVCAGCEVPTETPLENVQAMFDYARSHTP
jgi:MtaA/CmuA family methyltransferase